MNEKDLIVNILKLEFPKNLEKLGLLHPNNKKELIEINQKAMEIIPCITDLDPGDEFFSNLGWHEVALILYLNQYIINTTYDKILRELSRLIDYDIVHHIVQKAFEFYTDKLSELERYKYGGGKHPLYINEVKRNIKTCLNTLKETLHRVKKQKKEIQKVFTGKFRIFSGLQNKVQDIQFEEDLAFSAQYMPDLKFVENLSRFWLDLIEVLYPDKVCVTFFQSYYTPILFFKDKSLNKVPEDAKMLKQHVHELNPNQIKDPNQRLIFTKKFMQFFNNCDKDILLTPIHLISEKSVTGLAHANALIFNLKDKYIYRFEPHGSDRSLGANIDKIIEQDLKLYSEFSSYTYEGINKLCPKRYGVQKLEKFTEKKLKHPKYTEKAGFCLAWTLLFLEYIVLNIDNNVTPNEVYQHLIQNWDVTELIYKYIHRLIKYSYKYINYKDNKIEDLDNIITNWFNQPVVSRKLPQLIQRFDLDLYNYIYEGHVTFDQVVNMVLNQLNRGQNQDQITQYIDFFLHRLLRGKLYQSMKMINESMVKQINHTPMIEAHLPKSLWYYQDIVENVFTNCMENNEKCVQSLTNLFRKYFVYKKQLMYN